MACSFMHGQALCLCHINLAINERAWCRLRDPCFASGAFTRQRAVVKDPACCSGYMDEIRSNRSHLSLKQI